MSQVGVIRRPRASVARRGNGGGERWREGRGKRLRVRLETNDGPARKRKQQRVRIENCLVLKLLFRFFLFFFFNQPSINHLHGTGSIDDSFLKSVSNDVFVLKEQIKLPDYETLRIVKEYGLRSSDKNIQLRNFNELWKLRLIKLFLQPSTFFRDTKSITSYPLFQTVVHLHVH